MATFLELSRDTGKFMEQCAALAQKLGFDSSVETLREKLREREGRELTVVVAGEARRGKSSLLNALLNEKQSVFPVDVNVCTNVVTILRYGEQELVEAYIEDPSQESGIRIEQLRRDQIADYVSEKGNPNNYRRVKLLKAAVPNDLLKEGVTFVDTPGVGSLNVEHAETTYSFLPNADLLLFVSDADSGLTVSELEFLKRAYGYCKSVIFPLTKKDLNAEYQTILEDNRAKISAALEVPAEDVEIIAVSSMAKLRYLERGSRSMYINSNFKALEECIWTTVAKRRAEVLLLPYLVCARDELVKMQDNIAAQSQTLGQEVAGDLAEELEKNKQLLEQLQEDGADWRNSLTLFFSLLNTTLTSEQQAVGQRARDLLDDRIRTMNTQICEPAGYSRVISEINDVITQGILGIRELMEDRVSQEMGKLEAQLSFTVGLNEEILKRLDFQPGTVSVDFPEKKVADTVIEKGRTITMNSMGGTAIGSILGGLVGVCFGGVVGLQVGASLGSAVGGLLGGTKGCVDSLGKYNQVDVNAVNKALSKHIATSMASVAANVSSAMSEMRITMTAAFEKQLKKRSKELQENAAQLKKNMSLAQSELPKRQAELKAQAAQLQQGIKCFDVLQKRIASLKPEAAPKAPPRLNAATPEPKKAELVAQAQEEPKEEVSYSFL